VFYPWAHISYETAIIMGIHGNFIALCILLYLVLVRDRKDGLLASVCFLVYILNFNPIRLTLDYGQINLWTTVFICLFIYGYTARRHPAWTGLSLACAVVLKIYPAGLLAYLVLKRQWKAIGWCCAGIAACYGLAAVTIPPNIWEAWWEAVGSRGSYGDAPVGLFTPAGPWNQGMQGLVMRLFTDNQFNVALFHSPALAKGLTYTLALFILGLGGALLWWRDRRGLGDAEELELGMMLVVMVVVVPLSWVHHTVMILPGIIAAARALWGSERKGLWLLFFISACIVAWPWACFPQERFRLFWGGPTLLLGSIRLFGLFGLLGVMWTLLYKPLRGVSGKPRPAGAAQAMP
jgi:alpha-1,2-mannosyltransferase